MVQAIFSLGYMVRIGENRKPRQIMEALPEEDKEKTYRDDTEETARKWDGSD